MPAQTSDDATLIASIARQDRAALEEIYRRYHKRVFLFIRRFETNTAIAEDLANDVFLELLDKASTYEGRSSVSTWLLGIARFKALSEIRKRRNTVDPDDAMAEMEDEGDTPEVSTMKTDKGMALRQCIEALSPKHRVVVDLVYYHEKSVAEVAAILELPPNTIKTRMFHARQALSKMMSAAGLDRGWP